MKRKYSVFLVLAVIFVVFAACQKSGELKPSRDVEGLTAAPAFTLSDSLSSQRNDFSVESGNYQWNCLAGDEMESVIACGSHPLEGTVKERLKLAEYKGMDSVPYLLSCAVMPDKLTVHEWDAKDLGNTDAEMIAETECEDTRLLNLEPDRVYEILAEWKEDNLDVNGFYGTASYVIITE